MKSYNQVIFSGAVILMFLFSACSVIPPKAEPISHFDADRYLGKWYEIARIDNRFEKDLTQVTASYRLLNDGNIGVLNSGFDTVNREWKSAEGKAKFRSKKTIGALKVSFFGPFYAGYNVIALDSNYQYALVAGKNLDYLWILSRYTEIPDDVKSEFLKKGKAVGYDMDKLVWVGHKPVAETVNDGE